MRADNAGKKARAIELLRQGLDIGAIAERVGLSRNRIAMIAEELGLPVDRGVALCLATRRAKKGMRAIIASIRQNKQPGKTND